MSSTRGCPTARQLKLLCLSELKRGAWGFGALEGMKTIHRKMERVKVWQTNACRAKQRQWDTERPLSKQALPSPVLPHQPHLPLFLTVLSGGSSLSGRGSLYLDCFRQLKARYKLFLSLLASTVVGST